MTSEDLATFIERRRRFVEAIGDGLAIIPAARRRRRATAMSATSSARTRTSSSSPGSTSRTRWRVLNPAHAKERFVLFVRPRDREMEIWNGHRAGVEGAVATTAPTPPTRSTSSTPSCASTRSTGSTLVLPARQRLLTTRGWSGSCPSCARPAVARLLDAGAHRGPEPDRCTSCACAARRPSSRASGAPARSAATPTSRRCGSRGPACTSTRCRRPLEFVFRSQRLAAQRLSLDRRLGRQRVHPALHREPRGAWRTAICC